MGYFLSFFFFPPLSSVKQVFKIMKLGEDLVTMAFRFRPHMFKPTAISYKREGRRMCNDPREAEEITPAGIQIENGGYSESMRLFRLL